MGECEICGSKNANKKIKIDNAILEVCENCINFGEEIPIFKIEKNVKIIPKLEEMEEAVIPNFNLLIKKERTKRNLTQEELAKKLNEKVSVIKRIEEGWEPPINIIKKIERFFNIKLLEKIEEKTIENKASKTDLTIGDIVEVR
ncbi:MAG: multiprotein-bridging factor 1 family protein [Candidatus Aenigmatarchaeota archaeon]